MSIRRYPSYVDTNAGWIREVPSHWRVVRLGFEAETLVPMRDKPETLDGPIPWIRIEDFDGKYISASRSAQGVSEETVTQMNLKVFPEGTVLCSCSCSMGATAIVASPLVTNQTFIGLVPKQGVVADFLYYMCAALGEHLSSISTGAIQTYLSRDDFRRLRIPCPSPDEQRSIASFLDAEITKIDALVEEQQRLMDLMEEKRQAVIRHAVTKGLNPEAQMKPSGVEWLGEIPAHWTVRPLRWTTGCFSGDAITAPELEPEPNEAHSVPVIGGNGLMGFARHGNQNHDVLAIGRVGALCGNVHLVQAPAWITDNALVLDPDPRVFALTFLQACLRSRDLNAIASKTAQPLITGTQVGDQRMPAPPLDEQLEIMRFVTEREAATDQLIAEASAAVTLLQERRAALISAAVTGQIDVRHLVPAEAA